MLFLYFTDNEIPSPNQILIYWGFPGVILPLWIFILGFVTWVFNNNKRYKFFNSTPINKLNETGFNDYLKNEDTKWYFTEKIKAGLISDYLIKLDFDENNSKKISFTTNVEFEKFDSIKYNRLKSKNIMIDSYKASKSYSSKEITKLSINELTNELEEFVRLLKIEGYKPIK